jgi:hypothetical protein
MTSRGWRLQKTRAALLDSSRAKFFNVYQHSKLMISCAELLEEPIEYTDSRAMVKEYKKYQKFKFKRFREARGKRFNRISRHIAAREFPMPLFLLDAGSLDSELKTNLAIDILIFQDSVFPYPPPLEYHPQIQTTCAPNA